MKTKKSSDGHLATAGHGISHRATAWLLGLMLATAALLSPAALFAEVLDDFNDADLTAQRWDCQVLFGQGGYQVTNGQVQLFITPDGDHGFVNFIWKSNQFTVREGRTLELRVDLMSSSGDGAMARLGHVQVDVPGRANYVLFFDQDTAAVVKRPESYQLLWLTNGPTLNTTNVKMVVALTGLPDGVVEVHSQVLDNTRGGTILLDRVFYDTPAADRLGAGTDDPPGNLLGLQCQFYLGLYHDNAGYLDPTPGIGHLEKAVVTFDSAEVLEYDSAWVAPPSTALLLNWPENTAEEQIVIGAGSLGSNAVWAPWPEPIFKRFGQLSMAVPTTSSQLFLTLTPGTQFIEDFNPPKWPYASKGGWVPYFYNAADATRFEVTNVDNALRIHTLMPAVDGRVVILPPGPDVVVGDFYASVDIIDWPVQGLGFGIGARVWRDPDNPFPGNSIGYIGSVMGTPRELGIFPVDHPPPPAFTYDPTADYRLVFSAVGSDLSLRLVNLATGETVQMTPRDTQFQNGFVCFWMNAGPGGTCDITLDNFFVTGTKP